MRVALCLSGHARTYDQTYKFWKKNLLDIHKTDVFMHLWDTSGPRWFGPGRSESMNPQPREDLHSGIIDSPIVNVDDIIKLWQPVAIEVEPYDILHPIFVRDVLPVIEERDRRGIPAGFEHHHPLSVRSMLYKRFMCNIMKANREVVLKRPYDVVIQCRPDVALVQPLSEEIIFNKSSIYFHNSRSVTTDPEICDFGSIGTTEQINFYCNLYTHLDDELSKVGDNFFEFLNPHKMYVKYFNRYNVPYVETDLGMCILRDTGIVLGWPHAANIIRSFKEGNV